MTYDKRYAEETLGADCSNCPLRVGGKFVPSVGPDSASVAFVGEAPGKQEAHTGKPFVGPSGKLLNVVNNGYGIKREEVFLSNACLCRPADGSNPPKTAIAACRPRLLNELHGRGTGTVVALGNSAALSLLGVEGVTKLRVGPGRTSPYHELEGVRIIPTVHPAACLRQSDMFPSLVADVRKVVKASAPWTEPEYDVYDDPDSAIAFLRGVEERAGDVVVDIEVDIEKDTAFDHPDRYDQLCVGLAMDRDRASVIGENALADERVHDAMAAAFRASRLSNHNGKFDLAGLYPTLGPLELFFDTMLASYALDERTSGIHGLETQAVEQLGSPLWKTEIEKYVKGMTTPELEHFHGYGRIPRPILYKYNAFDVVNTWRLKELYEKLLETKEPEWWGSAGYQHYEFKNLRYFTDHLTRVGNEMMYLELNGIAVDKEYAHKLAGEYQEVLAPIEKEIDDILVRAKYQPINPRSPQQVKAALGHFRVRVDTTNKDTIQGIMDAMLGSPLYGDASYEHPLYMFCDALLRHRREQKLYSTYVKGTLKRLYRGRVYPTFMLHGSVSRTTSRNPNIQNIPRESKIKRMFIPGKPGNVFVSADYEQAEARSMAWLAQDTFLRDLLNDPLRDLFDELTPQLYGEDWTVDKVGGWVDDVELTKALWKDMRVRVKAFFYGLGYGRHWSSIGAEYKMPAHEAKAVSERLFATIPDVVRFQEEVKAEVKKGHDLITPFGRHRRFHLITNENWKDIQNEALSFLPQAVTTDIGLTAVVRVRRELRGSGAFIRNFVHDNILVDCPADMADDVGSVLDRHMREAARDIVGDYINYPTDVTIGPDWGAV
jgi:uracil-DNA glycosylase family 4